MAKKFGGTPRLVPPPRPRPSAMVQDMSADQLQKLAVEKEEEALRQIHAEVTKVVEGRGYVLDAKALVTMGPGGQLIIGAVPIIYRKPQRQEQQPPALQGATPSAAPPPTPEKVNGKTEEPSK